jgi:hypothetical protein
MIYLSPRAAQLRNSLVATTTGSITLIILLIAPLGLAAVIINTLLVTATTYGISQTADRIILRLQGRDNASFRNSGSLYRRRN